MTDPVIDLNSLVNAYDVTTKLIDHYGAHVDGVSLGQEGWIGLHLTQSVIQQAICEIHGNRAWLALVEANAVNPR